MILDLLYRISGVNKKVVQKTLLVPNFAQVLFSFYFVLKNNPFCLSKNKFCRVTSILIQECHSKSLNHGNWLLLTLTALILFYFPWQFRNKEDLITCIEGLNITFFNYYIRIFLCGDKNSKIHDNNKYTTI